MYTEADLQQNRQQLRARRLALYLPAAALLALTLTSFLLRWPEAVTVLLTIALGVGLIFCICLFISPVKAYGEHIDHALHGRTREAEGVFTAMEQESVPREGLYFYPMNINVGEKGLPEDDRLFYFDANLPRPDWQAGERLRITSYDNRVTDWQRVQG